MKDGRRVILVIMLCSILFGFSFWLICAALESLVLNASICSLYIRLLFLFGCIVGGVIVSLYTYHHLDVEKALALSEEQLKALIDSSFDAKILIDRDGNILRTNDKGALYLQSTEEELIGAKVYEFLPDDRLQKRKEQFDEVIKSKKPLQFDEAFDGHFYRLIMYPVYDEEGEVSFIAVTLRDTSQEKKAEEEIMESREYLALAMGSAGITIWEMWEQSKKMYIYNPEDILEDFEKKRDVNSYNDFWDSIHPDDRDMIGDALSDHFDGKTETYSALYRIKDPKGDWIWVNSFGKVVDRDEAGKPVKMIGIRVDVTNLHNYREAVIKANKKLNLLASITRHDILNQVTAIRLSEELLLSEDHIMKNSEEWDLFEVIFRGTEMIEKQISFTRDYQNLGISTPSWQKLSEIMKEIDKEAALMNMRLEDHTGNLEIYADPMFEKVIFNLIDNSSRHGHAKNFKSGYEIRENECILFFEDDGPGIADDLKDLVFDRGFGRNTGLGLFLVREILDITGIKIRETGKEGVGARFELIIPKDSFRVAGE